MLIRWHAGRTQQALLNVLPLCLFWAPCLAAQTVRPVIAEYSQKARGRFDLVNDTALPLNVVLEPKSFSISDEGSPTFRPLDKSIHLKLSQMSFRIPPKQTYYVFYEATADTYPAWFVIYATLAGLPERTTKSTAQGFYSQRCTLRPEATAPLISASSFTRRFELIPQPARPAPAGLALLPVRLRNPGDLSPQR